MFGLGTQELIVILIIALVLFGGKKLPEIGAGLGKGIRAFKKGLNEVEDEIKSEEIKENKNIGIEHTEKKSATS